MKSQITKHARCTGRGEYLKTFPASGHQMLSFTWELECFAEIMGEEGCQHQKKKKKKGRENVRS